MFKYETTSFAPTRAGKTCEQIDYIERKLAELEEGKAQAEEIKEELEILDKRFSDLKTEWDKKLKEFE